MTGVQAWGIYALGLVLILVVSSALVCDGMRFQAGRADAGGLVRGHRLEVAVSQDRCRPPKGVVCRRPPRNIYEIVRRALNRNGGGWAWETWSVIIHCESKWDPEVTGSAGERGLTQLHPVHIGWLGWERWAQMYTPEANVIAALDLYAMQGWSPWRATVGGC